MTYTKIIPEHYVQDSNNARVSPHVPDTLVSRAIYHVPWDRTYEKTFA